MGQVCGCQLMTGPLDIEALRRSVENLSYGAVVCYCAEATSATRRMADEERALFQMFAITEEAANRWDANVAVAQRLGDMLPGDTTLVIAAACTDRQHALDCCSFVGERMSDLVPVREEPVEP